MDQAREQRDKISDMLEAYQNAKNSLHKGNANNREKTAGTRNEKVKEECEKKRISGRSEKQDEEARRRNGEHKRERQEGQQDLDESFEEVRKKK